MSACTLAATLAFLAFALPSCAQDGFVDDFDSQTLNPRWQWLTPKEGPTTSLTDNPGHLRVTLPKVKDGFSHWTWGEDAASAPMLRTPAPVGDFSVESRIQVRSFGADSNFHLALVVGFSPRYVVGWGPFFAPLLGNPKEHPETWCEPTGQGHFLTDRAEARDVRLRIEKAGREYTFSLRRGAREPWKAIGVWSSAWPAEFVGFMGKTFGDGGEVVADIDFIRLTPSPAAEMEPLEASITVDCAGPTWSVNPWQFGHFVENMHDAVQGGIWAEMLRNRKFTGAPGEEGVLEEWGPLPMREGVSFARDNADYYCPAQSQRIEVSEAGRPVGILQSGIALRAGMSYKVRIVAKQEGLGAPLRVGFADDGKVLAEVQIEDIGADWTVREFELRGPEEEATVALVIATSGPGTVWLGAVSLMPADSIDGIRADVLAATRKIKAPIVRWPGGNFVSQHDWRDAIGERDRRPPRWNRAWGGWEFNDMGTDEFMRFCELADCEPYICVNCGEGSAAEAAAWVEYCNGPPDSKWGIVRARNGHPEPYGVRVWGIGNEIYGPWQHGHLSATNYGIKAVEFARAMRAVDPSIELVGVGVEADGWANWNREVCEIAGDWFDWLAVHFYQLIEADGDDVLNYNTVIGAAARVERMLSRSYDIAREASGKHLPIAFDEWNVIVQWDNYTLRDGLFACSVFNALNRLGEKVPMANLAQLVNVIGAIEVNQAGVYLTPLCHAFDLYANNTGPVGVGVRVSAPSFHFPLADDLTALDVTATLSKDRRTAHIAVVNRMPVDSVRAKLDLPGFEPSDEARVITLNAATPETANSFEKPGEVTLRETTIPTADALEYAFPPHSATVITLNAR